MAASTVSTPTEAPDSVVRAHVTSLRLMLAGWITHFRSLGYIKESTMHLLDRRICKTTADLTGRNPKVREAIGINSKVWNDLVDLFRAAMPSLEHRSYAPIDPVHATYEGPSSNAIVGNSVSLLKDLQRLDSMLAMARNILTSGEKVQNLAAQVGFDREVCSMINLCIKITARGYDGDGSAVDEDKWQGVINGFKKLLITSLQFLSNLVTLNERLKLMLWVELFDSSSDSLHAVSPPAEPAAPHHDKDADSWVRAAVDHFKQLQKSPQHSASIESAPATFDNSLQKITMPSAFSLWAGYERNTVEKSLADKQGQADPQYVVEALEYVWQNMPSSDRAKWDRLHEEKIIQIQKRFEQYTSTGGTLTAAVMEKAMVELGMIDSSKSNDFSSREVTPAKPERPQSPNQVQDSDHFWKSAAMDSAADGARKLDEGKTQLLRRLEHAPVDREQQKEYDDTSPPRLPPAQSQCQSSRNLPSTQPQSYDRRATTIERKAVDQPEVDVYEDEDDQDDDDDDDEDDEAEEDDEEDDDVDDDEEDEDDESSEDEEDDYAIPGEDGRGLLTDVPLILGPNEIEVLPMIIMSGIVASSSEIEALNRSTAETDHVVNMYTIRCHLLLAQENGRNLLRELLIFVAAWDLREEELYFKFMVKIMEAILLNGLMPFAYGAFKESKDIISPAQAVIMKLLTKIFHSRQGFIAGGGVDGFSKRPSKSLQSRNALEEHTTSATPASSAAPASPSSGQRYDVQIVHCLFSEFRQNIIPQICALIFLQGQIRAGHAHLEDFPLNLWDMERMYEGVYQYLEFFAILTDHDQWKQLMAEWEVTSELLTLLKELEVAIPRGRSQPTTPPPPETRMEASKPAGPIPVAVERPYDVNTAGADATATATATNTPSTTAQTPVEASQQDDAGQRSGQSTTPQQQQQQSSYPEPLHDEPADFEWRNLKKLCILVLSSLVWKSPVLQDQVRRFNGITTILACCSHDEHNPYIREHAIMCLRFLLEGNAKNQEVIKGLAEGWVDVPRSSMPTTGDEVQSNQQSAASEFVRMRSNLAVPAEVLDQQGYETFVDSKGQVGLRRKESPSVTDKAAAAAAQLAQAHGRAAASIDEIKTVHSGGKRTGLLEPGTGNFPDWLNMVMKRQG